MAASTSTLDSYFQFVPALMTDRAWWQRAAEHPRAGTGVQAVQQFLVKAPKQPSGPFASEFLAAKWKNDRHAVDTYWQNSRGILTALILNRCIDGGIEAGNDLPLLDWLWHYLTMPTWVVSAHLPKNDLPDTLAPQLDLAATEMAGFLAETLEVLEPWVEAQSPNLRKSIIQEIDRRVLKPFAESTAAWWYDPKASHVNNWSGVCAGSILAACEALARIGEPRPEARTRALDVLNLFLQRGFTPAGECDEGMGYWSYGVGFAILGWSRLPQAEFRERVDQERFRQVVNYPRQVHLFDNTFFSGNDASLTCSPPHFATGWLAAASGEPFFADWSRHSFVPTAWGLRNLSVALRSIDTLLRLPEGKAELPVPPRSRFITDQQAGLFVDGSLTVAFAGGTNAEAHNHNDLGHFNAWVGKECIIPDLGAPQYKTDFFGPKRYTYLSASSRGHCCPIINRQEQIVGGSARGELLTIDLEKQVLSIDLTSAYPPEARLARWTRTCRNDGAGAYQIVDEYCTTEAVEIENVVWSTIEPEVNGTTLMLGKLKLIASAPVIIRVEPVDPKDHILRDYKEMLYRISLRYSTEQDKPMQVILGLSAAR